MTQSTPSERERPRLGFFAGVLTTLAVSGGGFLLLVLTCRAASDTSIQRVILAPDSSVKAVLYVSMGGGGPGWCYQRLALRPGTERVDIRALEKEGEDVFSSSCSSDLRLSWLSPTHLHIAYTMDEAGVSVYQRPASPDAKVRLTYEVVSK